METNRINNHNQARNQEFFGAGKVSWNKGTSINDSCVTHKKKFGVFSPSCSQTYILNENLTRRCTQTGQIFPKIKALFLQNQGTFFLFSKKGKGNVHPILVRTIKFLNKYRQVPKVPFLWEYLLSRYTCYWIAKMRL